MFNAKTPITPKTSKNQNPKKLNQKTPNKTKDTKTKTPSKGTMLNYYGYTNKHTKPPDRQDLPPHTLPPK